MSKVKWSIRVHHLEGKRGELELERATELGASGVHGVYRSKTSVMVLYNNSCRSVLGSL